MASKLPYSENKVEAFQAVALDPDAALQQYVNFDATSDYSANLEAGTTILELFATQDCWLRLVPSDSSAVAAVPGAEKTKVASQFVPGGITCFLGIQEKAGTIYKVAVIRDTTSGVLYIKEGA